MAEEKHETKDIYDAVMQKIRPDSSCEHSQIRPVLDSLVAEQIIGYPHLKEKMEKIIRRYKNDVVEYLGTMYDMAMNSSNPAHEMKIALENVESIIIEADKAYEKEKSKEKGIIREKQEYRARMQAFGERVDELEQSFRTKQTKNIEKQLRKSMSEYFTCASKYESAGRKLFIVFSRADDKYDELKKLYFQKERFEFGLRMLQKKK